MIVDTRFVVLAYIEEISPVHNYIKVSAAILDMILNLEVKIDYSKTYFKKNQNYKLKMCKKCHLFAILAHLKRKCFPFKS